MRNIWLDFILLKKEIQGTVMSLSSKYGAAKHDIVEMLLGTDGNPHIEFYDISKCNFVKLALSLALYCFICFKSSSFL